MDQPTFRYSVASGDEGVKIVTLMACEIVTWGVYVPLAFFSIYALCVQGIRGSRPRQAMLAAILTMFACSSAATMYNMQNHWIPSVWEIAEGVSATSDYPGSDDGMPPSWNGTELSITVQWWTLQRFNLVSNDLIVMWRCWSLWRNHRRAKLVLYVGIALLFSAFTFNIIATVLKFNGERFAFGIGAMNDVLWVVPFPLINVVATGLIGYKTWRNHKECQKLEVWDSRNRRSVERILLSLTESGVLYCSYWLLIYISAFTTSMQFWYLVLDNMLANISGIYPTLVIVIVLSEKTIENDIRTSRDSQSTASTMQFTPGQPCIRHSGISVPPEGCSNREAALTFPTFPREHETDSAISMMNSIGPAEKKDAES